MLISWNPTTVPIVLAIRCFIMSFVLSIFPWCSDIVLSCLHATCLLHGWGQVMLHLSGVMVIGTWGLCPLLQLMMRMGVECHSQIMILMHFVMVMFVVVVVVVLHFFCPPAVHPQIHIIMCRTTTTATQPWPCSPFALESERPPALSWYRVH